jgi:hypothetical protein
VYRIECIHNEGDVGRLVFLGFHVGVRVVLRSMPWRVGADEEVSEWYAREKLLRMRANAAVLVCHTCTGNQTSSCVTIHPQTSAYVSVRQRGMRANGGGVLVC